MRKELSDAGLLAYRSYGGWGVQRPEHGTLGRYNSDMTKVLPDDHTVALMLRLDRAVYQLYREAGAGHDRAPHNSLLCPAWAGIHNTPSLGTQEIELQAPLSDRVELVVMLRPQDDRDWPRGEISLLKDRVGTGRTLTNLHWPGPGTSEPARAPEEIDLDLILWHRYRVNVAPGFIRQLVDGRLRCELNTPHTPHDLPLHLVVQVGANPAIREDWYDDLEQEQTILFRLLRTPGAHA